MAKRRPALTIFLDSSVLFSAVNSPTGGSAKIFTEKNLDLIVSTLVLTEVERNIRDKLADYHLTRFFLLVDRLIILASAKLAKSQILLTLDQRHFLIPKVKKFIKPTKILTPKMFFTGKIEFNP